VSEIAGRSAKNVRYCRLLFRLAYYLRPQVILEIGSSLGISTSYLASTNSAAKVITLEGCPNTANEAKKNFESLGLKNVEIIVGNFGTILPDLIHRLPAAGCQLVFFDGNHRKGPTLDYFKQCLGFAHNDSVFVFDDIHWSNEMEEAWEEIKLHPEVTVTIDLFFLGIIFFRKEQAKENFVIRY
jgi:predicted O-methyltransferase YrrM